MTALHVGLGAFGLGPGGAVAPIERVTARAERAERLGFESLWVPESHFDAGGALPAPLLMLAAIASRTRKIGLGTTSYLISVRHPIRVAEDVAVLDQLSGGRVFFGVGRGFRPSLFEAFGVPAAEKRSRFEANLNTIRRAWSGDPIEAGDGAPLRVTPRPLQTPHPPIWVAAFGPKALGQAGRLGLPYLASPMEPIGLLEENYARHAEALPTATPRSELAVPAIRTLFPTRSGPLARRVREALDAQARALAKGARGLRGALARAAEARLDDWALVGEPERVEDGIERYRERIGLTHVIARVQVPGAAPADVDAAIELTAELATRWR